jgi:hypothetical protein
MWCLIFDYVMCEIMTTQDVDSLVKGGNNLWFAQKFHSFFPYITRPETIFTGGQNAFVLAGATPATPASNLVPAQRAIFAGGCPPATPEPQCWRVT